MSNICTFSLFHIFIFLSTFFNSFTILIVNNAILQFPHVMVSDFVAPLTVINYAASFLSDMFVFFVFTHLQCNSIVVISFCGVCFKNYYSTHCLLYMLALELCNYIHYPFLLGHHNLFFMHG